MLFSSVRSVVAIPGPRRTDRGELPNVNGAGLTNAAVLNQWLSVCSSEGSVASPTRFGRSGPAGKAFVVFAAVTTVNGGPDCNVSRTPTRQFDRTASRYRRRVSGFTSYSTVSTK